MRDIVLLCSTILLLLNSSDDFTLLVENATTSNSLLADDSLFCPMPKGSGRNVQDLGSFRATCITLYIRVVITYILLGGTYWFVGSSLWHLVDQRVKFCPGQDNQLVTDSRILWTYSCCYDISLLFWMLRRMRSWNFVQKYWRSKIIAKNTAKNRHFRGKIVMLVPLLTCKGYQQIENAINALHSLTICRKTWGLWSNLLQFLLKFTDFFRFLV